MYALLHKSTLVTLALAIDFGHGGASDAKYTLFSAGDTEHQGFLLDGDEEFACFAVPLLHLDPMSFWASSNSHHKMPYGEALVVCLGEAKSSRYGPFLAGELPDRVC